MGEGGGDRKILHRPIFCQTFIEEFYHITVLCLT